MVQTAKKTAVKKTAIKPEAITVLDWDMVAKKVFWFRFSIADFPEQEINLPFWELCEHMMQAGTIDDYQDTGLGKVIIDPVDDPRYFEYPRSLHLTGKQKYIYDSYDEFIREHMNDRTLQTFIINSILNK